MDDEVDHKITNTYTQVKIFTIQGGVSLTLALFLRQYLPSGHDHIVEYLQPQVYPFVSYVRIDATRDGVDKHFV